MIDTYTFFDHAYDKMQEWEGRGGVLEKMIVNNYTDKIPDVMREVSIDFITQITKGSIIEVKTLSNPH